MRISPDEVVRHPDYTKSYYLPLKTRRKVLKRDGHRCIFCHDWTTYVAHDKLLCLGGTDGPDNLVTCCRPCRIKKDRMTVQEYKEHLETMKEGVREETVIKVNVLFRGDKTVQGEIQGLPSIRDRAIVMRQLKPRRCLSWINLDYVKKIDTITRRTRLVEMDL